MESCLDMYLYMFSYMVSGHQYQPRRTFYEIDNVNLFTHLFILYSMWQPIKCCSPHNTILPNYLDLDIFAFGVCKEMRKIRQKRFGANELWMHREMCLSTYIKTKKKEKQQKFVFKTQIIWRSNSKSHESCV